MKADQLKNSGYAERRAALCSYDARRLFSLICGIIDASPDHSCFASVSTLARELTMRKATANTAKWELIAAGALDLSLRENGNRHNPRHRLSLAQPRRKKRSHSGSDALSRVPDLSRVPETSLLYGLGVWGDCDRLTQIECYLKSGWNCVPLRKYTKKPILSKRFWAGLTYEQKMDQWYHDQDLGVGVWLDNGLEVFDFDGGDDPREDTLVSVRGDHSHAIYEASGEIYKTVKKVSPNIDTLAAGCLLVLPPSIHESDAQYRWYNLAAPITIPDALMLLWQQRKTTPGKTGFTLYQLPDEIPYGERNNTLWSFGRSLRAAGADREHIARRIREANQQRCKPPFLPQEIERQIEHIWRWRNADDYKPKASVRAA